MQLMITCPQTGQLVSTREELRDIPGINPRFILESLSAVIGEHFTCSLCGEVHYWEAKDVILPHS